MTNKELVHTVLAGRWLNLAIRYKLRAVFTRFASLSLSLLSLLGPGTLVHAQQPSPPALPPTAQTFRTWGNETLARIDADFWLPARRLYANEGHPNTPPGPPPAMMWDCGVQLSALAAAARVDPMHYRDRLRAYIDGLDVYWTKANGIGGYDVQPGPKPNDRYYDDNAWLVLALAEAYEVTRDARDLARAEATLKFVFSGEDQVLGGGLYWREPNRESKNTCTNAPAIVGAVRLYQLTRNSTYLADARRVYQWTCAHLRAPDGLFWDNVRAKDGHVDQATYSYNTGLMIRAGSLLHAVGAGDFYLEDARRSARAAEARWVDRQTGAMHDGGRFTHLLLEGFLALGDEDHDPRWQEVQKSVLVFVHEHLRDANGHYSGRWDRPPNNPREKFPLIDQASVARAFWMGARR